MWNEGKNNSTGSNIANDTGKRERKNHRSEVVGSFPSCALARSTEDDGTHSSIADDKLPRSVSSAPLDPPNRPGEDGLNIDIWRDAGAVPMFVMQRNPETGAYTVSRWLKGMPDFGADHTAHEEPETASQGSCDEPSESDILDEDIEQGALPHGTQTAQEMTESDTDNWDDWSRPPPVRSGPDVITYRGLEKLNGQMRAIMETEKDRGRKDCAFVGEFSCVDVHTDPNLDPTELRYTIDELESEVGPAEVERYWSEVGHDSDPDIESTRAN